MSAIVVVAWEGMPAAEKPSKRLESWKEVAGYLNTSVRTVQRWEQQYGLPIRRLQRDQRAAIYAESVELDEWLESRTISRTTGDDAAPPALATEPPATVEPALPAPSPEPPPRRTVGWVAAGSAVLLLAIAIFAGWRSAAPKPEILDAYRVTSLAGIESHFTVSPDNRRFAFASAAGDESRIIVQNRDGTGLRATGGGAIQYSPAWSPDSKQVAFLRAEPNSTAVLVWDPATSEIRRVGTTFARSWFAAANHSFPSIVWLRNGRELLLPYQDPATSEFSIVRHPLAGGPDVPVWRNPGGGSVAGFTVSPDEKKLAVIFRRGEESGIAEVPLETGGGPIPAGGSFLTTGTVQSPAYQPDGTLVFLKDYRRLLQHRNGLLAEVKVNGSGPFGLISSGPDGVLYWTTSDFDTAVWLYDLNQQRLVKQLCDSTTMERMPMLIKGTTDLIMVSLRTGINLPYRCDPATGVARQLSTDKNGVWSLRPSPDGRLASYVIFTSPTPSLGVARLDGSGAERLLSAPGLLSAGWSADSRRVYYAVSGDDPRIESIDLVSRQVRREARLRKPGNLMRRADGTFWVIRREGISILRNLATGGEQPAFPGYTESPVATEDGMGLYFIRPTSPGLSGNLEFWVYREGSGAERLAPAVPRIMGWAVGPPGYAYAVRNSDTNMDIFSSRPPR